MSDLEVQMAQVKLLLQMEPDNPDYLQLRDDLEELISLTRSGADVLSFKFQTSIMSKEKLGIKFSTI